MGGKELSETTQPNPEQEARKERWLGELSNFIIEANQNTWAADGGEVDPQRPGYKELEYKRDNWLLRDSYTGYFRAPGMTTVYLDRVPVWTMAYAGHGQTEEHYDYVKDTFSFLKEALMAVSPDLPIRGPAEFVKDDKSYTFKMLEGDLTDGLWKEEITESGLVTFRQTGMVGVVIHKTPERKPVFPWDS